MEFNSGFKGLNKFFAHLDYYLALMGSYIPTFQYIPLVLSSGVNKLSLEDGTDKLSRNVDNYP